MNRGIAPSRSAWAALPRDVRAAARRGEATLDVATAAVAYGRHLLRRARRVLVTLAVFMAVFLGVGLSEVGLGWWADDDARPAYALVLIVCGGMVALFVDGIRSRRLVQRTIGVVAAHPPADLPSDVRLGTRRPRLQMVCIAGFIVVALVMLPILGGMTPSWWIKEALGTLGLAAFIRSGPSGLDMDSALLDGTGIRLDIVNVHVPWTSVGSIRVVDPAHIALGIIGPVTSGGDRPGRWTRRALARLRPGSSMQIASTCPELAIWVAGQYFTPDEAAFATARMTMRGVRAVDSWRSP